VAKEEHIIISLDARHADNIFDGRKHVELRRRKMNIEPGATALIYVKLPVGSIIGRVTIASIHASSPTELWREYGAVSGLSKSEFLEYFRGAANPVALLLEGAKRYRSALSLEDIRRISGGFQPPQFFSRLQPHHPVLAAVGA
jgi:predicted transcriptional regulator